MVTSLPTPPADPVAQTMMYSTHGPRQRMRRHDLPAPHGGGGPQDRRRHARQGHAGPTDRGEWSLNKIDCVR